MGTKRKTPLSLGGRGAGGEGLFMLLALLLLTLSLVACGPKESGVETGTAALRKADTAGFERATSIRPFVFPQDHGPHPDYRDEWWYVTGNLDGPDGRRFGFQITFFRQGLKRGATGRASGWAANEAYMAHLALADVSGGTYTSFERFSRAAMGLAGAQAEPFKVWLDDWRIEAPPAGGFPWRLQARQDGVALDLELNPLTPPILNGEQGLSRKSAEPGNASYYYSFPRMKTQGKLSVAGQTMAVTGLAWLDREWGTSMLADNQAGWDWFSLQLNDGSELMFYRLRRQDGTVEPASAGMLIGPDGQARPLAKDEIGIESLAFWDSPGGGRYPARWKLTVKPTGQILDVRPVLADQEFRHDARYWEGAVDVSDPATGQGIGRGYVELTGYAAGGKGAGR